jgi:hypothetical protein
MKNKNLNFQDFLRKYRFIIPVFFILILIVLVVVILIFTSTTTFTTGGETSEETDPLSGQTIYKINQESEIGDFPESVELIGFDDFISIGFSYKQYEILTTNILEYFNTLEGIKRISVIKDTININEENQDITTAELISDAGTKYFLTTDSKSNMFSLSITITDQNNNVIYKK